MQQGDWGSLICCIISNKDATLFIHNHTSSQFILKHSSTKHGFESVLHIQSSHLVFSSTYHD